MSFNETIYSELSQLFDIPGYKGYRPEMQEAPNGDTKACPACFGTYDANGSGCGVCDDSGRVPNTDTGKRFLHVARKYDPPPWAERHLARAHWEACKVADSLRVPDTFYPRPEDGTLRVLEYPAGSPHTWRVRPGTEGPIGSGRNIFECSLCGTIDIKDDGRAGTCGVCPSGSSPGAGTVEHTDPDLFTVNLWRSTPEDHEQFEGAPNRDPAWTNGTPNWHIGDIGALVGLGPATPHRVPARPYVQKSIVYFAMPALGARLPLKGRPYTAGPTVREWLEEKKRTTRIYK